MRWLLLAGAVIVGMVVVMAIVGACLPVKHTATLRVRLARPPADIWKAITEVEAFPTWRPGVARVERLSDRSWREHGSHRATAFEVVEAAPTTRLVSRIADAGLAFGGSWTYEIAPAEGGSTLTITEDGE